MELADRVEPAWHVVIPVKPLSTAKSRLGRQVGSLRSELALAMAADTVAAAVACTEVRQVVVVTDDAGVGALLSALGAVIVPDEPRAGINPALRHGIASVRSHADRGRVAALAADLPALRPGELTVALRASRRHARAFVTDSAGTGTTMYAAASIERFDPRFGVNSAARHAADATSLDVDVPSLRRDVDTLDDLWVAIRMGVGPHTATLRRNLPARSA